MFGLNMRSDEDSYCVSFEVRAASLEVYMECVPGREINVDFGGHTWRMYVDARTRDRSHGQVEYRVTGRSISALLGLTPIHRTWPRTSARTVAQELAALEGLTVDWQALDWIIPDHVLEADGETPIAVIARLAKAAGAIVQTSPDGNLIVSPAYAWDSDPIDHFGIDSDILTMDEVLDVMPRYNLVRVSDRQYRSDSDVTLEEASFDPHTQTAAIKAWVHPWQASLRLEPTASGVSVIYQGAVTERVQQWVEFTAGSGSLEKPARRIITVDWGDHPDLGTITVDGSGLHTQTAAWSLALVTHERSYHSFTVQRTAALDAPAQLTAHL